MSAALEIIGFDVLGAEAVQRAYTDELHAAVIAGDGDLEAWDAAHERWAIQTLREWTGCDTCEAEQQRHSAQSVLAMVGEP
ncbi:MAG: hypothetical protein RLZZ450_6771 [Pseudomonadota bacterium]|jgi:hypothetical protein